MNMAKVLKERELGALRTEQSLRETLATFDLWQKDKIYRLNDPEVVLTVDRGQLEVEPSLMKPELSGAVLISESMVTKLNQEILVSHHS